MVVLNNQDSLDHYPMQINADQNCGIDPNAEQYLSLPINSSQFQLELSISDQCQDFDRHRLALGIDRGVLNNILEALHIFKDEIGDKFKDKFQIHSRFSVPLCHLSSKHHY